MMTLGKFPSCEMGPRVPPFPDHWKVRDERPPLQWVMANTWPSPRPGTKTVRWFTICDLDHRVGNPAASSPLGGGDKVEGGLWGEEEEELAPCNPPIPVWPRVRQRVLVACTRTACSGAPELRPSPIMTLCPLLLPLRLLLLLLISGAVCWAKAGPETESPVRTLQVETLVRRLWCPPLTHPCPRCYPLRPGIAGEPGTLSGPVNGEERTCRN